MSVPYSITPEILNDTHHDEEGDYSDEDALLIAKVVSIIVLGLVSFFIGIIPAQLNRWFNWNLDKAGNGRSLTISLLLCFGGGVLMFTTFLHLQPEVREEFNKLLDSGKLPEYAHDIQLSELVFCLGFFFVYLIEEVVHSILDRKHEHCDDEAILHRTMSVRKCSRGVLDNPPPFIPRVSLSNQTDCTAKSISTQILLDSSSNNSSVIDNSADLEYLPKILEPEIILNHSKKLDHQQKFFTPSTHSHTSLTEDDGSDDHGTLANSIRALCTILALSFHAVFEGLAVGLERNKASNVWYLAGAVAAHKFVISFCVGVELLSSKTRTLLIIIYVGTFAVVTPIGIGIGIALSHSEETAANDITTTILQGMAAGTILYVVFFEVLQRERANSQSGILQLFAIIIGFAVMFGLQMAIPHSHDEAEPELSVLNDDHISGHHHAHEHHHH